ncbi:ABC transporter permease subunit [Rhodospirillum rubrum]|uniref:Binding-protein-dependent transport systems inner membrane component n=1 Tax=Rhodospirillum rubrum (strain ATCC 11170 / ATH 1.1.1 / DSM 467 / LMG 4362 / NCIMB 8255 / S1) TaxID=269796 RepID=Q2RVM8_RHORT|nr:ABC transporter permease subunit [Rhodospirillum rubrum]ABC21817.1 Binding-protein-dependent transport systems inner membrane component [Rhodospirillum rubrum ATCC 11170]AEO47517.1 binding-protein dependent transport system inner membrane protein [Rhodospirillum rubrum F11]MBK5953374.1 putrescine ABC transporter permease [Rhodospirillum rubrum]QXG81479.1 ABC transporter permease subunit [Rhodospirillum rubrum]HAQ01326.1 putrescine ABC transporter permease [Rhodospirillum rubrum]
MTAEPAPGAAPVSRPPEILPGMAPWRMWLDAQIRHNGRRLVILVPYVWLLLFFVLPFAIVLKISFAEFRVGVPPYTALIDFTQDAYLRLTLALSNYKYMLDDEMYVIAYLNSLRIAGISTVLALLIGYPMAYGIARAPKGPRTILLFLVILPFWTSFLIRVYAWMGILKGNGLLNTFLIWTGVIDQPLTIMGTEWAVFIGIVYSYLPFMVLPLYATLEKLDPSLLEAAHDLGCRPWKAFLTITLPLSVPGIIAGSMLVFIPSVGEFVIPELLGGADTFMIGRVLWNEFFLNRDWPVASAVAVAMLLMLVVPIMIFQNIQAKQAEAAEERS